MKKITVSLLAGVLFSFAVQGQENDTNVSSDFSKWQVRLRGLVVTPDEKATIGAIGRDVDISTAFIPELDFTFFFTEN